MSMKLKHNPTERMIELRMGCGERLSLCQTQSLRERGFQQEQVAARRVEPVGNVERKQ